MVLIKVIGHFTGGFGIAEDARTIKQCLAHLGYEFECNAPSFSSEVFIERHNGKRIDSTLSITLFILPLIDLGRHQVFCGGLEKGPNDYWIAYSPWELEKVPELVHPILSSLDELWAQSDFVYSAYQGLAKAYGVKLTKFTAPVIVPYSFKKNEHNVLIDRSKFNFLTDLIITPGQNEKPFGTVKAFKSAFDDSCDRVKLIIKSVNVPNSNEVLQALKRFVDNDPRILWFNENLDRQQQIKLLEVADCFVSLHRGRVLAGLLPSYVMQNALHRV